MSSCSCTKIFCFFLWLVSVVSMRKTQNLASIKDANSSLCPENEAMSGDENLLSGVKYAFDIETKSCYQLNGYDGKPCKKYMKFYLRPDNPDIGFCDCDKSIPAAYNPMTNQCHLVFHQEYCDKGYWLQLDNSTNHKLECKPNPCMNWDHSNSRIITRDYIYTERDMEDTVVVGGQCYKLRDTCEHGNTIGFNKGKFVPECKGNIQFAFIGGVAIPAVACSIGSKWSELTESCKRTISFDIS